MIDLTPAYIALGMSVAVGVLIGIVGEIYVWHVDAPYRRRAKAAKR